MTLNKFRMSMRQLRQSKCAGLYDTVDKSIDTFYSEKLIFAFDVYELIVNQIVAAEQTTKHML